MKQQENDTILRLLTLLMLVLSLLMCISVFSFKKPDETMSLKNALSVAEKSQIKPAKNIEVPVKFYTQPNINYSTEKNIFETVRRVKA
ncbi:MAG TPA: hypothetical protein VGC12_07495 [Methyloradius sp.]